MSRPPDELLPWLAVTEETLLLQVHCSSPAVHSSTVLQDGLARLADRLSPPPAELRPLSCAEDRAAALAGLEGVSDPVFLSTRLVALARAAAGEGWPALSLYRQAALRALWRAKACRAGQEVAVGEGAGQGRRAGQVVPATTFSSRLALLLLFPLVKSQVFCQPSVYFTVT